MTGEMSRGEDPRQVAETYLQERQQWLADAVELFGVERDTDPREVFDAPPEVRANAPDLELAEDQEKALREIAGRFGIGGEADVKSRATHQIIEGGKPWKVMAEAAIADSADVLFFAGSPDRRLGDDERTFMQKQSHPMSEVVATEYQMVEQIARQMDGFTPLQYQELLPYGYDITNDFALITEFEDQPTTTAQFVKIGTVNDKPVILLRVDREDYIDGEGSPKFRNRPASVDLLRIVSDVLEHTGEEGASVGINTSNTYASRQSDTVLVGLRSNRTFDVGMYGRETLAQVKGDSVAAPTELKQIPGELHTIANKLDALRAELAA